MQDFPNLPKSWQVKTLGEVLSSDKHAMKRGPFGSSLKKEFFVDSGIRVFEQYNPINQDSDWKRYFITQEKFKELESFKAGAGDLLISCSGTLGKILELPQNVEMGIINQALLKIRLDNTQILNSYFVYLFNSPNMQRIILENTIGSAIQNIASVKVLKQIKIPIPPLEIQRRIVKRLDEAFVRIESGTKHLKSAKDNLAKYKQSLLKSAFNGTLTQDCPLSQGESTAESSLRENPQGFSWQSTHSLSQGESTTKQSINTHPLAPSAREGEQENCHTDSIHCHTERSEVSHQNDRDSSVAPLPQNDNDRNNLKSPLPCGGDLGVGSTRTHKVVDCHESLRDSRNDENSPSFAGGQSSSPSLNTSGLSSLSPSLAEGARGWVNSLNDNALDCHTDKSPRNDDKDSLNGESANLPQSWTIKTLGEVCDIYTGNSINKEKKEKEFMDLKEGLNYIGTKDIGFDRTINYENGVKIPLDKLKDFRVAKANVSLLCIEGGSAGRKIGFTNQKVCFVNKLCCFEPFEDESKFVYFYLQSSYFLQQFNLNMSGLIGGISKEKIKQIKIPIPPLETQKQIVAILDGHFTSADKVSAYIESCLSKAKQLKSSLLKSAFAGELT